MKRIAAAMLFLAATFTMTGSAFAENGVVGINVPFNFTVNGTTLPAGTYNFTRDLTHPEMLIIRDSNNRTKAMELGINSVYSAGKPGALVFRQYGGQYFLDTVRSKSGEGEIFFPATKLER